MSKVSLPREGDHPRETEVIMYIIINSPYIYWYLYNIVNNFYKNVNNVNNLYNNVNNLYNNVNNLIMYIIMFIPPLGVVPPPSEGGLSPYGYGRPRYLYNNVYNL